MKTITGLNEEVPNYDTDKDSLKDITYRRLFLWALGESKAKNGEESINMVQVGLKIRSAMDGKVDLENMELKLLKDVIQRNEMGQRAWTAHWQGIALLKIKEAEDSGKDN